VRDRGVDQSTDRLRTDPLLRRQPCWPRHRAGPSSRSQTRANIETNSSERSVKLRAGLAHEVHHVGLDLRTVDTVGLPMAVVDKRVRTLQAPSLRRSQASIMQQDCHRKLPGFPRCDYLEKLVRRRRVSLKRFPWHTPKEQTRTLSFGADRAFVGPFGRLEILVFESKAGVSQLGF